RPPPHRAGPAAGRDRPDARVLRPQCAHLRLREGPAMPEIITREQWGAQYRGGWKIRPLPATEVWLHYPGAKAPPGPDATFEQDAAYIRYLDEIGYQRFGPHNGYPWGTNEDGDYGAGISYSLLFAK